MQATNDPRGVRGDKRDRAERLAAKALSELGHDPEALMVIVAVVEAMRADPGRNISPTNLFVDEGRSD